MKETYGVKFTVSDLTKWLHRQGFSYKNLKGTTPTKANSEKKEAFIRYNEDLLNNTREDEPMEFKEEFYLTMATKITYDWIRADMTKRNLTIASRTWPNLMGLVHLVVMKVTIGFYETINSVAMKKRFKKVRKKYPKAFKIHLILDQGPYNFSTQTKEAADKHAIILYYLPPCGPMANALKTKASSKKIEMQECKV